MKLFEDIEINGNADEIIEQMEEANEEQGDRTDQIWSQAMQRIEEANLFKLLIKSPVFADNSASPEILEAVNKKIRQFAMKELEVLLGIAQPEPVKTVQVAKSDFDEAEVQALRILAAKLLGRSMASAITREPEQIKPEITPIAVKQNEVRTPTLARTDAPTAPKPQPKKTVKKASPATVPVSQEISKKRGYVVPPKGGPQPIPMPDSSQLMGMTTGMHVTTVEQTSQGTIKQGAAAVQSLIQQMTGGGRVHVDDSKPSDDSIGNMF